MTEQEWIYYGLGYEPALYPWLYPSLYPEYQERVPVITPELQPDPVPTPEPDPVPTPEPDPVVVVTPPPEEVPATPEPDQGTSPGISWEELGQLLSGLQTADDEPEQSEELPASEASIDPGDVVAAELDPGTMAIIEAIKFVKDELIQIGDEVTEMQLSMDSHPMLTTPFENYTVTEGLLLLLFLSVFIAACARMLRGGLSWLRS